MVGYLVVVNFGVSVDGVFFLNVCFDVCFKFFIWIFDFFDVMILFMFGVCYVFELVNICYC